jgi:hypothetical protein
MVAERRQCQLQTTIIQPAPGPEAAGGQPEARAWMAGRARRTRAAPTPEERFTTGLQ